jgi:hypothetical protein
MERERGGDEKPSRWRHGGAPLVGEETKPHASKTRVASPELLQNVGGAVAMVEMKEGE